MPLTMSAPTEILCFKTGSFSLVNDVLRDALPQALPEHRLRWIDVVDDVLRRRPALHALAVTEAVARYARTMLALRLPPLAFLPRTQAFATALRDWTDRNVSADHAVCTFQTQSLFDASRRGLPHFVYTDHTYLANLRYPQPKPLLPTSAAWQQIERGLYRHAAVNFTTSTFAGQSIVEDYGVPADRVECVFSGINIPPPSEAPLRRGDPAKIIFVGVDWERKGGPELAAAFAEIAGEFPAVELHIIGCRPAVDAPRVRIHGRIPAAEIPAHLAEADIFCMPSRVEPSAVALVEAAACGLPVIATDVGGNAERMIAGTTGLLVGAGAATQLADALRTLLRNRPLREQMGRAGSAFAMETFTWPAVAAKMASRMRAELAAGKTRAP